MNIHNKLRIVFAPCDKITVHTCVSYNNNIYNVNNLNLNSYTLWKILFA